MILSQLIARIKQQLLRISGKAKDLAHFILVQFELE